MADIIQDYKAVFVCTVKGLSSSSLKGRWGPGEQFYEPNPTKRLPNGYMFTADERYIDDAKGWPWFHNAYNTLWYCGQAYLDIVEATPVIRTCTVTTDAGLRARIAPSTSSEIVESCNLAKGATFSAHYAYNDGLKFWYCNSSNGCWYCAQEKNTDGTGYDYIESSAVGAGPVPASIPAPVTNKATSTDTSSSTKPTTTNTNSTDTTAKVLGTNQVASMAESIAASAQIPSTGLHYYQWWPTPDGETGTKGDRNKYDIVNLANFPDGGNGTYDFTTNVNDGSIKVGGEYKANEFLDDIHENLNIFSAWSKLEINKKYHTQFNRFKISHPDIFMRGTIGYIFITRPDLNLFENGNLRSELASDSRVDYLTRHDTNLAKSLTHDYDNSQGHNFNTFLSNMAESIDVQDDAIDTLETAETFTGYKFQYSKHNIKSITAGTFNIKFKETFDLGITNTFQLWVDYESNVYRGIFTPKEEYIWGRNVDYMCNVYYFLLDQNGEDLLFWSKYFGCFPQNVPKSPFSYDFGNTIAYPDMSVTFSYVYREDLSPNTLVEFNNDAGVGAIDSVKYMSTYDASLGHSGRTWVGIPFISSTFYNNGIDSNAYGFKLRFGAVDTMKLAKSYSGTTDGGGQGVSIESVLSSNQDRLLVMAACGYMNSTMSYLDKHKFPLDLYRKMAAALRTKAGTGKTGSTKEIFQQITGFDANTMAYLDKWPYAGDLYSKFVRTATDENPNSSDVAKVSAIFQSNTINYMIGYKYSYELFNKIANSLDGDYSLVNTDYRSFVQANAGLNEAMAFLDKWYWADDLYEKLAKAMAKSS